MDSHSTANVSPLSTTTKTHVHWLLRSLWHRPILVLSIIRFNTADDFYNKSGICQGTTHTGCSETTRPVLGAAGLPGCSMVKVAAFQVGSGADSLEALKNPKSNILSLQVVVGM
jgi:hypothetical protein